MRIIEDKELDFIVGGAISISALLNSLSKISSTVLNIGRSLGSALRRATSNNMCACR